MGLGGVTERVGEKAFWDPVGGLEGGLGVVWLQY